MGNENAIYLGDIDPNNNILPVMTIRRIIMFQLLVWDRIILSDSQFLTDPRLNILMRGYTDTEISKKYKIDDVSDSHKGIEALFENGFIEVALRRNQENGSSLSNTWNGMKRSEKAVPYLPEDENYVKYLTDFKYNTHIYETANMGAMFKDKLLKGIDNSAVNFNKNNSVDTELIRMFNERIPLFRNILDFLRVQKNTGKISTQRFTELYDYVYSCYNVNISETLECNINTKFAHIPFHIESGVDFMGDNPTVDQISKLRHTWALNSVFLDFITFDEFVKIKNELKKIGVGSKVREFYLGNADSPWNEIEDAWDAYTRYLELEIKEILYEKKDRITNKVLQEFGVEKYLAKPRQNCIRTPVIEVVKSCVSFDPIAGTLLGPLDAAKNFYGAVITLSKAPGRIALAKEYDSLANLVKKDTRVVTKY